MLRSVPGLTLLLALVAGCGWLQSSPYPQTSSIPAGEQIVLEVEPLDAPERYGYYLLDPATETLSEWRLQGGRGINEGSRSCWHMRDQHRWETAQRMLVYSGSFGCNGGLYHISADGVVTEVPLPALPQGVTAVAQAINSPSGQLLAVIGTVTGPADVATQQIYVAGVDGRWTGYGGELGIEEITSLRWSPDSRTIAFIGGFDGLLHRRIFRLNLERGEVRTLSEDEILVGDVPTFTSRGELLFAATTTAGQEALYLARPEAAAVPIIAQPAFPARILEFDSRTVSPDGRFAAFSGTRDQPTRPSTVYVVDLATGEWRDLLPGTVTDERTGERSPEAPWLVPLAWAPDGARLLVLSDRAGRCSKHPMTGTISCSAQLYLLPAAGETLERLGSSEYKRFSWAAWLE